MTRESMTFDVLIVGAGPSGLSAAIRLKQLANIAEKELSVCVLEKGAEVGSHILSGAVLETRALDELLPHWKERDAPISRTVTSDEFLYLTPRKSFKLPTPPVMNNQSNYIVSLGNVCRWLAKQAEELGVEIYAGFPASELLYDNEGQVIGVGTPDMGVDKMGEPTPQFQSGMNLYAKQTILAEGCRGSLSLKAMERFSLRENAEPQTYSIGLKEIWHVKSPLHQAGKVTHTVNWPLDKKTYGGSFVYHLDDNKVALGFVVGLDYTNPWLDPFAEFQRFKTHPTIAELLKDGERLSYGAKSLVEGGIQSIPKLTFPGGVLIGDCAGFLNVPKIKGSHTAMKSGMLAAEAIFQCIQADQIEAIAYPIELKKSWVWSELYEVRNIRPAFHWGLWFALVYSALDNLLFKGKLPWTFKHGKPDNTTLKKAVDSKKIDYPKPDGKLTFDRASSLFLSGTFHEENQPCHLRLKDVTVPIEYNLKEFQAPEQRYCPAGVYEIIEDQEKGPRLHINAQNCLHCKTCDIKDPKQNIVWTPPEGGGGPRYSNM
jgi:electron-transferring-flavoprotein dehydrogenase